MCSVDLQSQTAGKWCWMMHVPCHACTACLPMLVPLGFSMLPHPTGPGLTDMDSGTAAALAAATAAAELESLRESLGLPPLPPPPPPASTVSPPEHVRLHPVWDLAFRSTNVCRPASDRLSDSPKCAGRRG